MLKDNIKSARKSKGISQEELAIKLNVVRQTISKWEQGLSVPDAEMLISISETFDIPVSGLLGEDIEKKKENDLKVISEKLEVINLQLSQKKELRRKTIQLVLISICVFIVLSFILIGFLGNNYMELDYNNPEWAVLGVLTHSFIWIYVRVAPIIFIGLIIGIIINRKK